MKTEIPKVETPKTESRPMKSPATQAPAVTPDKVLQEVQLADMLPDPANRTIDERSEELQELEESVQVCGVLVPPHVRRLPGGKYEIVDGHRRWLAARKCGRTSMQCVVWPESTPSHLMIAAGIAMNECREPHGCLHVARRLRQLRNELGLDSCEDVAARTGVPLRRVKLYQSLFNASDLLFELFEDPRVTLKLAVQFVRYERAAGEVPTRHLVTRFRKDPFTANELEALRKRVESKPQAPASEGDAPPRRRPLSRQIEAAFKRDPAALLTELQEILARFGHGLVPIDGARALGHEPVGAARALGHEPVGADA